MSANLPEKSDRAFRTISEAAEVIGVPQHVLRFWETRFSRLQPLKRGGNRRYYRPADMALLETIRSMLHDQGLTIRGAKLLLGDAADEPRDAPAARQRATGRRAGAPPAPADTAVVPRFAFAPAAPPTAEAGGEAAWGIDQARLRAIRDRLRSALAA